ncbi:DUF4429 domain-containing protein [Streptomyces sp. NPDC057539]|uniref:DUF4429 domain-containing protein n=1 Tax=Streptomyces sp. NPDC057539 TaxID=3346159 RepID=UPI0036BE388D
MDSLSSVDRPEDAWVPGLSAQLEGDFARLDFDGQRCVIRYRGNARSSLRRALSGRPIPVQALADAVLSFPQSDAKWGTLRIIPRPGVDAVAEVLGNQLPESADPYLIRFHRSRLREAEHVHRLVMQAIRTPAGPGNDAGPLVPVPSPPQLLRAIRSRAEFDGRVVRLSGGAHHGADGATRVIPLAALDGVTYLTRPTPTLRLHVPGVGASDSGPVNDPYTLLLNASREGANVLFAARLLEAHAVAAAARSRVTVRTERVTDDYTVFAARAELAEGEPAGSVRVQTPPDAQHVREIEHLQVDQSFGISHVRLVEDALLHAVLRWGYASGAPYLRAGETTESGRQGLYRRHGFSQKATPEQPEGAPQPYLVLGSYVSRREHDVLRVLADVSPRRRRAAGCGSWVLGFFFFLALLFVAGAYGLAATPRMAGVPVGFFAIALPITLFVWPLVRAALRASELKRAKDARATLLADPRPPVLYLRSFKNDKQARRASRPGSLITEEEAVSTAMAGIGPFIGLDKEIETLGAAKARVKDEDWRPAVTMLMSRCQLTMMRCGEGESLFWELQQAVRLLRPEQFVILVPRDRDLYETFRERAAQIMPHPLPELSVRRHVRQRLVAAIRFSGNWRPRVIWLRMPFALRFFSLESCLVFRLLPQLREFSYARTVFWIRRAQFFFVTAGALYVLIGTGLPILEALTTLSTSPDLPVFPTVPSLPPFPTDPPPSNG